MSKDYHFNDLAFIQIILDDYGKKNIFYQKYKDHQRVCIWKDQKYYVYVEPVGIMELNLVIAEYEVQQKGLFKKRDVYFNKKHGFVKTSIYDRSLLRPNHVIKGPAIVEQMDSTIVIPPQVTAKIDRYQNIIMTYRGE